MEKTNRNYYSIWGVFIMKKKMETRIVYRIRGAGFGVWGVFSWA